MESMQSNTHQTKDPQQLWQKCMELLRASVGDRVFRDWFAVSSCETFADGKLVINVPSDVFKMQYEYRFAQPFWQAIDRVFGPDIDLYYNYKAEIIQNDASTNITVPGGKGHSIQEQEQNPKWKTYLNPSYSFDNYCVGKSNQLPYTIAKTIGEHPEKSDFNPFFIYGSVGVGKTHLMQSIGWEILKKRPKAKVLYVTLRTFQNQLSIAKVNGKIPEFINFYSREVDVLLIDDIQELSGKKGTIEALFPIYNHLHQSGKKLIFACDRPPMQLEGIVDRMIDRFKWGSTEPLPKPDLALRKQILQQKARVGGLDLSADVIDVIAHNVDGSVRELEGVVAGLINRAIFLSVPITKALAIEVMRNTIKATTKSINFEMIVEITAEYFKINPDVIFSKNRVRDIADARQIIMYLAHKHLGLSSTAIGTKLKRKHCTVLHGIKAVEDRIATERSVADAVEWIENELKA